MAKLNQIIAVEKGVKSRVYGELTELNKMAQKPELFNGFSKAYLKKDEESEDLPSEKKKVQITAEAALKRSETILTEALNVIARKDWTNCKATATVSIDGKVIVPDAPVTYLLFLEKQLNDIRTFIGNLPVLDESDSWTQDVNSGLFKSEAVKTHRTKKIQRPVVLYPATPEHAAQTQLITEDIVAGYWETIKQSGALPKPRKAELLGRVEELLNAVKTAREEANEVDEKNAPNVGAALFGYILQ